jgi:hypothetical protein
MCIFQSTAPESFISDGSVRGGSAETYVAHSTDSAASSRPPRNGSVRTCAHSVFNPAGEANRKFDMLRKIYRSMLPSLRPEVPPTISDDSESSMPLLFHPGPSSSETQILPLANIPQTTANYWMHKWRRDHSWRPWNGERELRPPSQD